MIRLNETENTFVKNGKDMCRCAVDVVTGKHYVKVAEVIPSDDETDPGLKAKRDKVLAQNPCHYASATPGFTGYWIEQSEDPTAPVPEKKAPAKGN